MILISRSIYSKPKKKLKMASVELSKQNLASILDFLQIIPKRWKMSADEF